MRSTSPIPATCWTQATLSAGHTTSTPARFMVKSGTGFTFDRAQVVGAPLPGGPENLLPALDAKVHGLTGAGGPPAGLGADEPRPHPLDDSRGPVRHPSTLVAFFIFPRPVAGHRRSPGALERSAHPRRAAGECH